MKVKAAIKWFAIFLVLSIWTVVVIQGVPTSLQSVNAASPYDFNEGAIYTADNDSLSQVTKNDLLSELFFKNFTITQEETFVPSSKYSIRASNSISEINNIPSPGKNELNINVVDSRNKNILGSLIVQQNDGTRLTVDLNDLEILRNTPELLVLEGQFDGRLDRQAVSGKVRVNVNKTAGRVGIVSTQGLNFRVDPLTITLCQFCDTEHKKYNLLTNNGNAGIRSIVDVRNLLKQYPVILDEFKSLSVLNTPAWVGIAPIFVS